MNSKRQKKSRRGKRRASSPRRSKFLMGQEIVVRGRDIFAALSASGSITLNPASFARTTAVSDLYMLYRFTKLIVITYPRIVGTSYVVITGLTLGASAALTSSADLVDSVRYSHITAGADWAGQPGVFAIHRGELLSDAPSKWFRTIQSGVADDWDELQGIISYVESGTGNWDIVVEYECEMSEPIDASATILHSRRQLCNSIEETLKNLKGLVSTGGDVGSQIKIMIADLEKSLMDDSREDKRLCPVSDVQKRPLLYISH